MLDALNPIPVSHIDLFGHPWHGLVHDGTITLPNGQTMPYPQPPAGDAHLIQVPGAPGGSALTPDQLATEAAAGRSWTPWAILAGGYQVWGARIGGWIYSDPDSVCWLVTIAQLAVAPGSNLIVRLARFGDFGGISEAYDHQLTIPAYTTIDGSVPNDLRPVAFSPTGDQAMIGAFRLVSAGDRQMLVPFAWAKLEISGLGANANLVLSLALDGDQTAQIGEQSVSMAPFERRDLFIRYTSNHYQEPGNPYHYDDTLSITGVAFEEVGNTPRNVVRFGQGSTSLVVSSWVFSFCWHGGRFVPISMSASLRNAYDWPVPSFSAGGSTSCGQILEGDKLKATSTGGVDSSGSRTCSTTSSLSMSIAFDGEVVDSASHSMSVTDLYEMSCSAYTPGNDGGFMVQKRYLHRHTEVYDGATVESTPVDVFDAYVVFGNPPIDLNGLDDSDASSAGILGGSAFAGSWRTGPTMIVGSIATDVGGFGDAGKAFLASWVARDTAQGHTGVFEHSIELASNALALLRTAALPNLGLPSVINVSLGSIHGPGGASAAPPTSDVGSVCASLHPITGEIAVSPDGSPICWV